METELKEWEKIFNTFLVDEDAKIKCPNCQKAFLKFSKISKGNRLFLGLFCENCGTITDAVKVKDLANTEQPEANNDEQ